MPKSTKLRNTASLSEDVVAAVPAIRPIVRPSLHNEVVGRLRALIVDCDLLPGSTVPELAICKKLGISRTPLREALKVLAAEGLVTLMPQRGAMVTKLDAQSIDHMFQVLESLEPLAGELACSHMPQSSIDEVRHWHDELIRNYKNRKRDEYFRLNQRIHEAIVKGCGNPILIAIYEGLGSRVHYARYMANLSADSWKQAVEEHEEILDALVERNGKKIARVLRRHLRHKREYIKDVQPLKARASK
jgi:DNA-binding GntR family transcriptional regulator